MIFITDANIIFSAVIKPSGVIGKIIFSVDKGILFAPDYLKEEIYEHKPRLVEITGKISEEIELVILSAFRNITFYSADIIPDSILETALEIVTDIDPDDFIYVAFALFFNTKIWSGDKILAEGLRRKGFDFTLTTQDVAIAIMK